MSFSTSLTPLLARIVLCAAFLPAGFHKIFSTTTFSSPEAEILERLQVGKPVGDMAWTGDRIVHPASWTWTQDEGGTPPVGTLRGERSRGPGQDPVENPQDTTQDTTQDPGPDPSAAQAGDEADPIEQHRHRHRNRNWSAGPAP